MDGDTIKILGCHWIENIYLIIKYSRERKHILQIAKEKEGLQETGDVLDYEVKKAEDDLETIQQIFQLVNMEGDQFRSNLHHLTNHSKEKLRYQN